MAGNDRFRAAGNRIFRTPQGRISYLVVAVIISLLVGYNSCTVYVRPNEFGIKQITYGAGKGIKPDIYRAGLHYVGAGERMHTFPTDVQMLNLTNEANERAKDDVRRTPPLNIQTSEGYNVTVDISLIYRIEDPYKVFVNVGPGKLYEDSLMIPRSEQNLRKRLGELDAEEFYNVKKRMTRVALALEDLN